MTWFTWRQFRTQTWIAVGGLAVIGIVLAITGRDLAHIYSASGAAACHTNCTTLMDNFLQQAKAGTNGTLYNLGQGVVYVVPALIGVFWGAPLIARELEAGTYRLVWNQSVTRTRWLATKLAAVGLASMATAGLLSLAFTWWAHRIDQAAMDRIAPLHFGARGIVPVGYAAFAFALGVTAGMLTRRTVPAMAATLAVYTAAVLSMPLWVRAHLLPASHATPPLDMSSLTELRMMQGGGPITVVGDPGLPGAWVLSDQTLTPAGQVFTGPADPKYCGGGAAPRQCLNWVGTLNLHQDVRYQPASHFWPLQWTETGVFLAAALLLVGFCFWWTRRRLT